MIAERNNKSAAFARRLGPQHAGRRQPLAHTRGATRIIPRTEPFLVYDKASHRYISTISSTNPATACQACVDTGFSRGRKAEQLEAVPVAKVRRDADLKQQLLDLAKLGVDKYRDGQDLIDVLQMVINKAREIPPA